MQWQANYFALACGCSWPVVESLLLHSGKHLRIRMLQHEILRCLVERQWQPVDAALNEFCKGPQRMTLQITDSLLISHKDADYKTRFIAQPNTQIYRIETEQLVRESDFDCLRRYQIVNQASWIAQVQRLTQ